MDMTGYGQSSRPMMDDPCNLNPRHQEQLVPRNLKEPCNPSYPFELVSSDSETADIDRVVDFIRALRGVDKIALLGWSGGGIRTGTYTARYPEKVDKWIVHASSNYDRKNPDGPPAALPKPGFPMVMQVREVGERQRWLGTVKCQDTIEPGMPELIWKLSVEADPLAANWGPGGLRAPTRTYWGWNAASAAKIKVPINHGWRRRRSDCIQPRPPRGSRCSGQDVPRHHLRNAFRELGEAASRAQACFARMA